MNIMSMFFVAKEKWSSSRPGLPKVEFRLSRPTREGPNCIDTKGLEVYAARVSSILNKCVFLRAEGHTIRRI